MATFEISIDDEKIQEMLQGDRGKAALMEPILNQILQAEMTDHLGARPEERTDDRRDYRNGTYERKLTTRVGRLELEVARELERWYDIKILMEEGTAAPPGHLNARFSEDQPLREVLSMVGTAFGLTYDRRGESITFTSS